MLLDAIAPVVQQYSRTRRLASRSQVRHARTRARSAAAITLGDCFLHLRRFGSPERVRDVSIVCVGCSAACTTNRPLALSGNDGGVPSRARSVVLSLGLLARASYVRQAGGAAAACGRGEHASFQLRPPRAYLRSGDGLPDRHHIGGEWSTGRRDLAGSVWDTNDVVNSTGQRGGGPCDDVAPPQWRWRLNLRRCLRENHSRRGSRVSLLRRSQQRMRDTHLVGVQAENWLSFADFHLIAAGLLIFAMCVRRT